jgi:hypothetical protein
MRDRGCCWSLANRHDDRESVSRGRLVGCVSLCSAALTLQRGPDELLRSFLTPARLWIIDQSGIILVLKLRS